jgi:hypothetical protein
MRLGKLPLSEQYSVDDRWREGCVNMENMWNDKWPRNTDVPEDKPVPIPFYPLQIPVSNSVQANLH